MAAKMLSGIQVFCFSACYAIALALELASLRLRFPVARLLIVLTGGLGFAAHTWYLGERAAAQTTSPLASPADWYLLAAWVLAAVYLYVAFYHPRSAMGLFVLPALLLLIGGSQLASEEAIAPTRASRIWSLVHGTCLLLGTVSVIVGFLAGIMYLLQSHRLKRKLPPLRGFQLPSLEWLERVNSRTLAISVLLFGAGFGSGLLLSRIEHQGQPGYVAWNDPVVVSLALMVGWLVVAEVFRLLYPAARRGRKVAYLTLAAFVFLVLTLASLLVQSSIHGPDQRAARSPLPSQATSVVASQLVQGVTRR